MRKVFITQERLDSRVGTQALMLTVRADAVLHSDQLVNAQDLNTAIEQSVHDIFVVSPCASRLYGLFQKLIQTLQNSKHTEIISIEQCHGGLVFSRKAWERLEGFRSQSSVRDLLQDFLSRGTEARLFAVTEFDMLPTECRFPKTPKDAHVLFFAPYGAWAIHNQVDAMVATALRERGAKTTVVTCDGLFSRCYALAHSKAPKEDCAQCASIGGNFFSHFKLPLIQLRDFGGAEKLDLYRKQTAMLTATELRTYMHDGLELGRMLAASVCSYFRVPEPLLREPHVVDLYREYLACALYTYDGLSSLAVQQHFTGLCLNNGYGFLHTAAFLFAKKHNLPILAHERGLHDGSFILSADEPSVSPWPYIEIERNWKDVPLSNEEMGRIKTFFMNREEGKDVNCNGFYNFKNEHTEVKRILNIPSDAKVLSVMTSTEYELMYAWDDFHIVSRQMDIIDKLIEEFRNRDEYLVIRHHPNIGGRSTATLADHKLIARAYEQARTLPPNVRMVMPHEKLTSYALVWNSDACITFFSTFRHEALARGIPVASLDHPQLSHGLSHVISDETPEGLHQLVNSLFADSKTFSTEDLKRLYKTSRAFYFLHSIRFLSFEISSTLEPQINIQTSDQLRPGFDLTMDRVCDFLLSGSTLYPSPTPAEKLRAASEEDVFFKKELTTIKEQRASLIRSTHESQTLRASSPVAILRRSNSRKGIESAYCTELFSAWTTRQRYRNFSTSSLGVTSHGTDSLALLQKQLRSLQQQYVLIAQDRFQYDEAFLSSSVRELEALPEAQGILWGAWIKNQEGEIVSSVFSQNQPHPTKADMENYVDNFTDPLSCLSLGVFRREFLLAALEDLSKRPDAEISWEKILQQMQNDRVLKPLSCMVVVHAMQKNETIDQNAEMAVLPNQELFSLIEHATECLQVGKNLEALNMLKHLLQHQQDSAQLHFARAVAENKLGMTAEAGESLRRVLEADPEHEPAKNLLGSISK